ncbi:MAG: ATP-binding protein [Firmicutes bacterium]|nr:ATP-binding protein [Bacillota bacterium]
MEDLAQHILDIAINSLEAGATRLEIVLREDIAANVLSFKVLDNGRGISESDVPKMLDPFYTTKKHKSVGLGIPLLQETVSKCGGTLEISALPNRGTRLKAAFPHDHLDRAPLGDIAATLVAVIAGNGLLELKYSHHYNKKLFTFNTSDLKPRAGGIPLQTTEVLGLLAEYLTANITELRRENIEECGGIGSTAPKTAAGNECAAKRTPSDRVGKHGHLRYRGGRAGSCEGRIGGT